MPESTARRYRPGRPARWTAALGVSVVWLLVVALAVAKLPQADGVIVALAAPGRIGHHVRAARRDRSPALAKSHQGHDKDAPPVEARPQDASARRRRGRARAGRADARDRGPGEGASLACLHAADQRRSRRRMPRATRNRRRRRHRSRGADSSTHRRRPRLDPAPTPTPTMSGDYSTADMVNRLDPVRFRWIESSTAEQILLGWELEQLRQRSFLDVVHPDDRRRTEETFAQALSRGEALGLVVRIRTAHGSTRAIEVNVGARYGSNQKVTHLRCHLTDVTEKVQAERALKLRTLELTQVNEQLRRINHELEEVKQSLAHANDALSQRNRELDEFVYVVSHDLQEPLRTLIAFSDFLLKDYGDKLEAEGQEFVRYLVDASRRMRAMIYGMLNLARAGKVIGEPTPGESRRAAGRDQDRSGRAPAEQGSRITDRWPVASGLGRP